VFVQVRDQSQKIQQLTCEVEMMNHKRVEAQREATSLREELRAIESRCVTTAGDQLTAADDAQRLREQVKKLELQRDLAKQCSDNAVTKVTALEGGYASCLHVCVHIHLH